MTARLYDKLGKTYDGVSKFSGLATWSENYKW